MDLKPIKTRKIYEEIVDQIRDLVIQGKLKPGDKLPSERELVEQFQVSRASIREALSALQIMGLLEVRSGEGTFVKKLQSESVIAPLTWMLTVEKGTALELIEVRKILEVQAVGIAAERAEQSDLRKLEEALKELETDLKNGGGEHADQWFHYVIILATKNEILIKIMDTISDIMKYTLKTSRYQLYEGKYTPELLYQEHVAIYEAIKNRNSEIAKEYMLNHLRNVEGQIV